MNAAAKEAQLLDWFRSQPSVLIGFSGGVDSAYLASLALEALGPARVLAVTGVSPSFSGEQRAMAREVAAQMGLPVLEVPTREMDDARYAANPSDRCYFCKNELWTVLGRIARERAPASIVDGTNADDLADVRPGARAAREHGVRSPLADAGLTKAEIRERSSARGLPASARPSSPCLASRLPYGTAVTVERLAQVERAERALRALGIAGDLRVRHHGDLARVELARAELDRWLAPAALRAIRDAVRGAGFARAAVDLRGFRSGSLNVLAGVTAA